MGQRWSLSDSSTPRDGEVEPPPVACLQSAEAVIDGIRAAQENGLMHGSRHLPPYSTALSEMRAGRKQSHWIWYVWPSLAVVRPHVQLPQYLLPNLAAACLYLEQTDLRNRLIQITAAATSHLQAGVPPEELFGVQHRHDAPKFHETLTAFAIAARLCGERRTYGQEVEETCLAGISAVTQGGGLHQGTIDVLCGTGDIRCEPDELQVIQALVARCGVLASPRPM